MGGCLGKCQFSSQPHSHVHVHNVKFKTFPISPLSSSTLLMTFRVISPPRIIALARFIVGLLPHWTGPPMHPACFCDPNFVLRAMMGVRQAAVNTMNRYQARASCAENFQPMRCQRAGAQLAGKHGTGHFRQGES